MRRIKFFFILGCLCFCASSCSTCDAIEDDVFEEFNYIEFRDWQTILTSHGMYVIHDKIYRPEIMGFDKRRKLYYIPYNSEVIGFEELEKYPELCRKIDQIWRSLSHQ